MANKEKPEMCHRCGAMDWHKAPHLGGEYCASCGYEIHHSKPLRDIVKKK
jgi:ribosomal protein L37E